MLGKAKDFVRDNPVVSTGIGIALLIMLLDFSGEKQTLESQSDKKRASKRSVAGKFNPLDSLKENSVAGPEIETKTGFSRAEEVSISHSGGGEGEDFRMSMVGSAGSEAVNAPALNTQEGQNPSRTPVDISDDILVAPTDPASTGFTGGGGGGGGCFGESCIPGGGTSSGGTTSSSGSMSVVADLPTGIYVKNPTVTLTGANVDTILYCLSNTSTCCEPTTVYTLPILVSTQASGVYDPGNFCLSFKGTKGTLTTATTQNQYAIDSSVPALAGAFYSIPTLEQVQTNETQHYFRSTSTDFGSNNFFFYTLALEDNDPSVLYANDCEQTVTNHPPASYGMRSPAGVTETNASTLVSGSDIDMWLSVYNGVNFYSPTTPNYIVSVMEYRDPAGESIYSCLFQNITLYDFSLFSNQMINNYQTAPNANDVNRFQGMIQYYGPFGGGAFGEGVAPGASYNLEAGFVNIIN